MQIGYDILKQNAFILIFIIGINFTSHSQSLPTFSESTKQKSTLYLNVTNRISMSLNGCDPSRIEIKGLKNAVVQVNDSTYNIKFNKKLDEAKAKLYYKRFPVDIYKFNVESLPLPIFVLNDFVHKTIELSKLVDNKITLSIPEEYQTPVDFDIYTFQVTINNPKAKLFRSNVRGNTIPANIVNLIKRSDPGTKVELGNFRLKTSNRNIFHVNAPAIVYKVID